MAALWTTLGVAAMALLERSACAAMQNKQSFIGGADGDASAVTRTPLEAEKTLPKTSGLLQISNLQMNRSKGGMVSPACSLRRRA